MCVYFAFVTLCIPCCPHGLQDSTWRVIDADTTIDALQETLIKQVGEVIAASGDKELGQLWV